MKILHCNTHDSGGGAAIAAMRLHQALLQQGVDSSFGTLRCTVDDPTVVNLSGRWRRVLDHHVQRVEQLPLTLCGERPSPYLFSPGLLPSRVDARINDFHADIVHLHWIAYSFIPIRALGRITPPVVWSLHDTWGITGGCHIFQGCNQYQESCAACPQVAMQSQYFVRKSFSQKRKAYTLLQPTIVAPSLSLQQQVLQSALAGDFECRHIPNGIDTIAFSPIDKPAARSILHMPQGEAVVAFGAVGAASDRNKGYDLLLEALARLPSLYNKPVRLLVFGASQIPDMSCPYPVHCLGHLHDEISLRLAYSAADVFVCPSREENLPNTVMESLACGTPVAAFAVGGIPDMVEHGVNGMLATPHDPVELAHGIASILSDDGHRDRMGEAARRVVEERYAIPIIAGRYKDLYVEKLDV